jgi:hypothetical protein
MLSLVVYFFSSGIGQALTIAAITAAVGRTLTARGKLAWAVSHQHFYRMPRFRDDGFFPVRTQQIWFQNLEQVHGFPILTGFPSVANSAIPLLFDEGARDGARLQPGFA